MAKLYAELSSHETARKVSKSSNTRLVLEVYEGNELIGTLKAYPIAQAEGGHRITWQHAKRGMVDFIQVEDPTITCKRHKIPQGDCKACRFDEDKTNNS